MSVYQKPNPGNRVNLVNPAPDLQDTAKADALLRFAPLILFKILVSDALTSRGHATSASVRQKPNPGNRVKMDDQGNLIVLTGVTL